ncbi:hypothetical protein BATDEDRAFT_92718 [Batrachochytrium dendrobatidis JAM81]|uniref:PCI domain-containing protein n=1 Tax=Batrachochytrium dendrobatidis (strain JAM81 / FGSC 10211) TaxID=684364 RepID=F4PEI5_BATDJ|nr:uncharacterized protein BATDEDRAFT_92718 [Batrachochytrium dendrobatidis JAM81]EGF76434.1 hypothetical protein BATDEDRAFT_92718 [Batrachochytrium dendrobatidis JAM81]|eukprot:XP_006683030.1 hypothetical protein BATDEDRAFT_92718 [Batrachochytrium dendrobatidis JAM81]
MQALSSIVQAFENSLKYQDGHALSVAFTQLSMLSKESLLQAVSHFGFVDGIFSRLHSPFKDFFSIYVRYMTESHIQRPLQLDDVFKQVNLYFIHLSIYGQLKANGKTPVQCGLVQTALNDFIRECLRRVQPGTESGLLAAANAVLRMSFESGELHVCTTVIAQIEMHVGRTFNYTDFSKADQVAYYFQLGKLKLRYHDFVTADQYLSLSSQLCTIENPHVKRTILSYQIVTRVVRGCLPSNELLYKYRLAERFIELIFYVKTGNYHEYIKVLDRHRSWFMKRCLYMIMKERVVLLMYRNLFQSSVKYFQQAYRDVFNIPLAIFIAAVQVSGLSGENAQADEVECVLVSLIDQTIGH